MSSYRSLLLGASVASLIAPTVAMAQGAPTCFPLGHLEARLNEQYGEQRTRIGVGVGQKFVMQIFESEGGGTWTIVLSYPDGRSCIYLSGEQLMNVKPKDKGSDL